MTEKPMRCLAVMATVKKRRIGYSVYPVAYDDVYGKGNSPLKWVNYYVFGSNRYRITIVSPLPSIAFDRETALYFATGYAARTLQIVRYDLNTGQQITGYLDIDAEQFITSTAPHL